MEMKIFEKLVDENYIPISIKDLREEDTFRVFNSDGSIFRDIRGSAELVALSNPFLWSEEDEEEEYAISYKSIKKKKNLLKFLVFIVKDWISQEKSFLIKKLYRLIQKLKY